MAKALIVVDMQNDFVSGVLGSKEAQATVPNVVRKIQKYYDQHADIVCTLDTHDYNYLNTPEGKKLPVPHCIRNTEGWLICPQIVNTQVPFLAINKETFGYPYWDSYLGDDLSSIELVGVCTDICVVSNALILKALYPETEIIVDASCCAGTTPEAHQAALRVMQSCQITVIGETLCTE